MQKDWSKWLISIYIYHRINPFFGSITNHARMKYRYRSTVIRAESIRFSTTYRRSIIFLFFLLSFFFFFFNLSKKISTTRYILGLRRPQKYVQYVLRGDCIKTYVGTRFAFRNHIINSVHLFSNHFALLFDYLLTTTRYKKIALLNKGPDNNFIVLAYFVFFFFIFVFFLSFSFERN